jgi:catechol 2,3-dioxygenase-like lactoylglutathione lyase family enzyme
MELIEEVQLDVTEFRLFHVGIAVNDLEAATNFFERVFDYKLVSSRIASHAYLGKLVGCSGVAARINMLRIDENNLLEILEWKPVTTDDTMGNNTIKIHEGGAQHLCFYTNDAALIFSKLKLEEVEFVSETPILVEEGPNQGARVFFIKVFGFLYIEIFQRY